MGKIVDEVISSIQSHPDKWDFELSDTWMFFKNGGWDSRISVGITVPPLSHLGPKGRFLATVLSFGFVGCIWLFATGLNYVQFKGDKVPLSLWDKIRLARFGDAYARSHIPTLESKALKRMHEIAEEAVQNMESK